MMTVDNVPEWVSRLDEEDINFIKNFVLSSGSLKEVASHYEVSYPTVRLRLDRLIQKITLIDENKDDAFIALVKRLAVDDKLDYDTAKTLIKQYRTSRKVDE